MGDSKCFDLDPDLTFHFYTDPDPYFIQFASTVV